MKKGLEFEDFVEYVYFTLINDEHLHSAEIHKRHTEIGRSGTKHEIDVYYEIMIAGIRHKVAIECKQHNRPITKGMVQEFKAKLDDCNNIIGFMVASKGYQSGAKEFAEHYGIKTLTADDLPKINELLATAINWLLPSESSHGDPFWTIMESKQGENTGTYITIEKDMLPLFFSKKAAQTILERSMNKNAKVYGVTLQHLKGICAMAELLEFNIGVCPLICLDKYNNQIVIFPYTGKQIREEYLE